MDKYPTVKQLKEFLNDKQDEYQVRIYEGEVSVIIVFDPKDDNSPDLEFNVDIISD